LPTTASAGPAVCAGQRFADPLHFRIDFDDEAGGDDREHDAEREPDAAEHDQRDIHRGRRNGAGSRSLSRDAALLHQENQLVRGSAQCVRE
jgi:hypothetical protein